MTEILEALHAMRSELKGRHLGAQLLTLSEAARRLGISRSRTLPLLIEAGALRVVVVGARKRIPATEIERLCRDGFTVPTGGRRKRARVSAPKVNAATPSEIAASIRGVKI